MKSTTAKNADHRAFERAFLCRIYVPIMRAMKYNSCRGDASVTRGVKITFGLFVVRFVSAIDAAREGVAKFRRIVANRGRPAPCRADTARNYFIRLWRQPFRRSPFVGAPRRVIYRGKPTYRAHRQRHRAVLLYPRREFPKLTRLSSYEALDRLLRPNL